jgi:Holliday junction resolvasome RuvABC endonuclease subunit
VKQGKLIAGAAAHAFFDLGTVTGYAFSTGPDMLVSGRWDFSLKKGEGYGARFLKFRRSLDQAYAAMRFETAHYEEVHRHIGTIAAHVYGGLKAELTAFCEARNIVYAGVGVGTIKKSFTGSGNAKKAQMIAEANRRGFITTDDNEADAIALAIFKLTEMGLWTR